VLTVVLLEDAPAVSAALDEIIAVDGIDVFMARAGRCARLAVPHIARAQHPM
jgi:2-keto-3-deoxy-L-rhamnonate aldolase RhmA